jgi:hypothetical protein
LTEEVYALAIHPRTGEVYVAGWTSSNDFPNTSGGAQANNADGGVYYDAFVAKLNSSLTQILQATYLGGSEWDKAFALAIHPTTDNVYVAGCTRSRDFPGTSGGAQPNWSPGYEGTIPLCDGFIALLNSTLTSLIQSTYLGEHGTDYVTGLSVHPNGDVYVAGYTGSFDFPGIAGGAQTSHTFHDAFVARLSADLTSIIQSTYLGGSSNDWAEALAIHPRTGEVYVAGITYSTNFPNTAGGAQASNGGGRSDGFVARLPS